MKRILLITSAMVVILSAGTNSVALTPHRDTSQTEDSIPSIRGRYAAINKSVRKYKKVKKELSGFSLEGGELIAYFNGSRIVKITAAYFGESGRAMEEYYYWNEKLIFVFRRDHAYNKPMSAKVVSTKSNRFYFGSDRLIRWIDDNGKAKSSSDGKYQAKQQELLETSNKFLKAARSPEPVIEARNTTNGQRLHAKPGICMQGVNSMMNENIGKPDTTEYLSYYGKYISLVPDADILTVLDKQIEETAGLLNSIPEARANFRYAPDKWSIKGVVGHMIDTERIFAYRALRFARDDKTPLSGYEQDDYVTNASFDSCTLTDLAAELKSVRQSTLFLFKHLDRNAWMRRGLANNSEASVRALAHIIAGHELHHRGILRTRYLSAMGLVRTGSGSDLVAT